MSLLGLISGANPKELAEDVFAARSDGGVVPPNCIGMLIGADGVPQYSRANARASCPRGNRLFFVRTESCTLEFAPEVDEPEVGVRLCVGLHFEAYENPNDGFARLLTSWGKDTLTHLDLINILKAQHIALPPCAQPDELKALCTRLSCSWQQSLGLRCLSLERLDLGEQVDTATLLREHAVAAAATGSTSSPQSTATPLPDDVASTTNASSPAEAADPAKGSWRWQWPKWTSQPSIPAIVLADAALRQRLFVELPRLSARLRATLPMHAGQSFTEWRQLSRRVDAIANGIGALPTLEVSMGTALSEAEKRLRHAQMQRACDGLTRAWELLGPPPTQGNPSELQPINVLDRVIASIEVAVTSRKVGVAA